MLPGGLGDQYFPFESVGVAEEDALDAAEVVDGSVARRLVDQRLPNRGECFVRGGLQADMIDASPSSHGCLALRFGVAFDHEDVQLGVRADADDGHRFVSVVAVGACGSDVGVEHVGVEPAQAGSILGDSGYVVDTIEQHVVLLTFRVATAGEASIAQDRAAPHN